MPMEFLNHSRLAQHFTEGVTLTTKAAFHHFAGEFGGPLDNMTGPTESG